MPLQRNPGHRPGRLQVGRSMIDGPAREALRRAVDQLDAAERRGRAQEMSAALAQVGRCYRDLSALAAAEDALRQALRWARATGSADLQVDLLCELAETACLLADQLDQDDPAGGHAARERARDEAFEASSLAHRVADVQWEMTTLLRISDLLNRCGDHDDAAWLQTRAMGLMSGGTARG